MVLPTIETVIVLPFWFVLALSASNAAFNVAYEKIARSNPPP